MYFSILKFLSFLKAINTWQIFIVLEKMAKCLFYYVCSPKANLCSGSISEDGRQSSQLHVDFDCAVYWFSGQCFIWPALAE